MRRMLKDKHVIVAMLVAPILAIIAWYGVDQIVAEKPEAVVAGETYTLLARSNCRYNSGRCDLENADLELSLVATVIDASGIDMQLESTRELQGAMLGLVNERVEQPGSRMAKVDGLPTRWSTRLALPSGEQSNFRIAVRANDATFYAEVPTVFIEAN